VVVVVGREMAIEGRERGKVEVGGRKEIEVGRCEGVVGVEVGGIEDERVVIESGNFGKISIAREASLETTCKG
jgi:hypothetical protein